MSGYRLRIAGVWLQPSSDDPKRSEFNIVIPAPYEIIARAGSISGTLDGQPYLGPRFLDLVLGGLLQTSDEIGLALLWSQAGGASFYPV